MKNGKRIILRCFSLLALSGLLFAGRLPASRAESNTVPQVSWNDVTPTAHYRNRGDWLVDVGWSDSKDIYGPFPTKQYQQGDTERFFALDFEQVGPPRRLMANLMLVTDHAYWWFEEGTTI